MTTVSKPPLARRREGQKPSWRRHRRTQKLPVRRPSTRRSIRFKDVMETQRRGRRLQQAPENSSHRVRRTIPSIVTQSLLACRWTVPKPDRPLGRRHLKRMIKQRQLWDIPWRSQSCAKSPDNSVRERPTGASSIRSSKNARTSYQKLPWPVTT